MEATSTVLWYGNITRAVHFRKTCHQQQWAHGIWVSKAPAAVGPHGASTYGCKRYSTCQSAVLPKGDPRASSKPTGSSAPSAHRWGVFAPLGWLFIFLLQDSMKGAAGQVRSASSQQTSPCSTTVLGHKPKQWHTRQRLSMSLHFFFIS